MSDRYDFIIAGGGLAGLSLALHVARSPLRDQLILIIDRDSKDRDDRTWGFWTNQPTIYDHVVCRAWERLRIVGENFDRIFDLGDYRYQVIRGIDFYRFARRELASRANVTFRRGRIDRIEDGCDAARVKMGDQTILGQWVFDSTFSPSGARPVASLQLRFKGWEIETAQPAFDPHAATFFDFRTPQRGDVRFCYVLPFTDRRALVEYTAFTAAPLGEAECAQALKTYLESELKIAGYRIAREEHGSIPLTDRRFARQAGRRVLNIGAKAGRIKPTTGYAFTRIQHDSAAIVRSMLDNGHPFDAPGDSTRYRLYDTLMLHLMRGHGDQIKPIFTAMFKNNPIGRNLRFLDERGTLWENLELIATLPPRLFLQAIVEIARPRRRTLPLATQETG